MVQEHKYLGLRILLFIRCMAAGSVYRKGSPTTGLPLSSSSSCLSVVKSLAMAGSPWLKRFSAC